VQQLRHVRVGPAQGRRRLLARAPDVPQPDNLPTNCLARDALRTAEQQCAHSRLHIHFICAQESLSKASGSQLVLIMLRVLHVVEYVHIVYICKYLFPFHPMRIPPLP
jgi:hypothetical protein